MSTESLRVACSNCNLRELCLPVGLSANELTELDALVSNRRRIKKGAPLYTEGAEFQSLFAIRSGFFKTRVKKRAYIYCQNSPSSAGQIASDDEFPSTSKHN